MSEVEVMLPTSQQGLRVLTLDGGGIRGLSELLILKEILDRIRFKSQLTDTPLPCEYFDLIAGTSTGGLIAIMLGRLRMSVDEAITCYGNLAKRVFSDVKRGSGPGGDKFKATILKDVIREILKKHSGDPDEVMLDSRSNACKTFVCAMSAHNMNAGIPRLFRTYLAPKNQLPDCKIWEAARATTAAPTFFKRVEIGTPGSAEAYIDGGMANNNPIKTALRELELIFPDRSVSSIISIGTGHSRTIQIPTPGFRQKIIPLDVIKAVREIASDCEKNAEEIAKRFESSPGVYFRFNVEQGLQDVALGKWEMLGDVTASTRQYIGQQNTDQRMDSAVLALQARSTTIPTSSLNMIAANNINLPPQSIPPAPKLCIGRETDRTKIVDLIIAGKSTAILGGGGMGKTTLALAVLHDEMVTKRFATRYFIDCEGITTLELILGRIADALRIPAEQRDGYLLDRLLLDLHKKRALMCIDNFESLWDSTVSALKVAVERCLEKLTALPDLVILLTMRGNEPPFGVESSHVVSPLAANDASEMFATISKQSDQFASKLVDATDGIPLALELLTRLIGPNLESPESLWRRWQQTGTSTASRSADPHRLLSLDASIELFIESPRVKGDPTARVALGVLSLLPDGLANPSDVTDGLASSLAIGYQFVASLTTLTRTALAYIDETNTGRYRLLSPISEYVTSRRDSFVDSTAIEMCTDYFARFMWDRWDYTDHLNHEQVPSELLNIQSVLNDAIIANSYPFNETVVRAIIWHTRWNSYYMGIHSPNLLHLLLEREMLPSALRADCSKCLAEINVSLDRLKDAEADLLQALDLHQQVLDISREGGDRTNLGNLFIRMDRLEEAEMELLRAVELHQQAQDARSEGTDRMHLGELYMRLDRLEEAETELLRAVELHKQAQSVLGEASDRVTLGELYMRLDRLNEAETELLRAVELHQQTQDVPTEGTDRMRLGELYMRMGRLEDAETELLRAVELHKQAQSVLGEASDRVTLGELYMRLDRLNEAETELLRAVELHQQTQDVPTEGTDRMRLGELYMRMGRLEDAETELLRAVELHQQAQDVLTEGTDRMRLGELYMRLDRLGEAETELLQAVELHQQAQSVLGEGSDRMYLGQLYLQLDRLEEVEAQMLRGVELHQHAHSVYDEGIDRLDLGKLYLQQGRLSEAESELSLAISLSRKSGAKRTESNASQLLSEVKERIVG